MAWSVFETGLTYSEALTCILYLTTPSKNQSYDIPLQPTQIVPNRGFRDIYLYSAFDILNAFVLKKVSSHFPTATSTQTFADEICELFYDSLAEFSESPPKDSMWQDQYVQKVLENLTQIDLKDEFEVGAYKLHDCKFIEDSLREFIMIIEWMDEYLGTPPELQTTQALSTQAYTNSPIKQVSREKMRTYVNQKVVSPRNTQVDPSRSTKLIKPLMNVCDGRA